MAPARGKPNDSNNGSGLGDSNGNCSNNDIIYDDDGDNRGDGESGHSAPPRRPPNAASAATPTTGAQQHNHGADRYPRHPRLTDAESGGCDRKRRGVV